MVDKTVGLIGVVFLIPLIQYGHSYGANYPKERQFESSRLRQYPRNRMRDHSRQNQNDDKAYLRPGANSFETLGRNNYGHSESKYPQNQQPYQPPQAPNRRGDNFGNNQQPALPPQQRNNYPYPYNENSREIVINDNPRPSIDDEEEEDNTKESSFKCKPFYSLNCERFCPAGNSLDINNCRTCVCCPVLKCKGDCSHGVVTHGGCATCNCKTPPSHVLSSCPRKWCTKECKLGFVKDSNGCPLCRCKRRQYKTKWHSKFQ